MALNKYFHACLITPPAASISDYDRRNTSNDREQTFVTEPHVYETSSLAYEGLASMGQNQAICVSGESGAGKLQSYVYC